MRKTSWSDAIVAVVVIAAVAVIPVALARRATRKSGSGAESDAVAAMAVVDVERGKIGAARDRLNRLERSGPGWGFAYAWDPFADGSVNPKSTIYAYTTSVVGLAFVDAYDRLRDKRYLAEARKAADVLAGPKLCCWLDGRGGAGVWYSNQPSDRRPGYRVYNVSALTLALLSQTGTHPKLAVELKRGLLAARTVNGWRYRNGSSFPNDLPHASVIALGLYEAGARAVARAELSRLWSRYLPAGSPRTGVMAQGTNASGPSRMLWALAVAHECRRGRDLSRRMRKPSDPQAAASYAMARVLFARAC